MFAAPVDARGVADRVAETEADAVESVAGWVLAVVEADTSEADVVPAARAVVVEVLVLVFDELMLLLDMFLPSPSASDTFATNGVTPVPSVVGYAEQLAAGSIAHLPLVQILCSWGPWAGTMVVAGEQR